MELTEKQKNCPYCHVQHRSDVLPDNGCYAKPIVGDYNHLGAGLWRGGDAGTLKTGPIALSNIPKIR